MFIGRNKEIDVLKYRLNSHEKEIIAIYGRRRIGKSEILKHVLSQYDEDFVLMFSGKYKEKKKDIVINLKNTLKFILLKNNDLQHIYLSETINSIKDFFYVLRIIHSKNLDKKFIVSFDEISYLNYYSGFLEEFAFHWNEYFYLHNNVKFIFTGSVVSWIKKNISNAKNGLHNRVTEEIYLKGFSLEETRLFFKNKNLFISDKEIFLYHLIFGGVPYYYQLIDSRSSFYENVNKLFKGILKNEFNTICEGLFSEKGQHKSILEILANNKNKAFSSIDIQKQLKEKVELSNIDAILKELQECDFIKQHFDYKQNQRTSVFSISDSFIYFYLNYLTKNNFQININNFYINTGYLFELYCLNNVNWILKKIGLEKLQNVEIFYFQNKNAQIDLLLKRPDNYINLIECKFLNDELIIDHTFNSQMHKKLNELIEFFGKKYSYQIIVASYEQSHFSKNLFIDLNYQLINIKEDF